MTKFLLNTSVLVEATGRHSPVMRGHREMDGRWQRYMLRGCDSAFGDLALIDRVIAVSYTHLDVYKRQSQDCLKFINITFNTKVNMIINLA